MNLFWDDVFELTGCRCTPEGHPQGNGCYVASVVEAVNQALLDQSEEWV